MTQLCFGIFFLASSWLFGTDYYYAPNWTLYAICVMLGLGLVATSRTNVCAGGETSKDSGSGARGAGKGGVVILWVALLIPAMLFARWPHRLVPIVAAVGCLLMIWSGARPRWREIGGGLTLAAFVLWAQGLALLCYRSWTARSPELPAWAVWSFQQFCNLLGIDVGRSQSNLMLFTMRETHALGGTWGLFLDPPTLCFIVGIALCIVLSYLGSASIRSTSALSQTAGEPEQPRSRAAVRRNAKRKETPATVHRNRAWLIPDWCKPVGIWMAGTLAWLFLRAGLLVGLYLHRALLTDYDATLNLMPQFWNPWVQMSLLLPLVIFQARIVAYPIDLRALALPGAQFQPGRAWASPVVLAGAATVLLVLGISWDPVGQRKAGRIAVDEHRTRWEPTARPFDTEWYGHLSGYNYASIYDYCSRFYDMSRLTNVIDDAALENLDVLMVKVPTDPYDLEEIGAIIRFVERGGGLLLVGEHTDVFGTGYNLNAMARRFGFEFRYDCLFGIDSFFDQTYEPSVIPHPVVQHVRNMEFATSCSIRPTGLSGRSVITSTGLKNSLADYHVSNYYPQAVDQAAMRYGAFVQLWAERRGAGRVLAFTDSTIFSNFCTFEPGKAELMLGMLEWLNHRDRIGNPRPVLLVLSGMLGLIALVKVRKSPAAILGTVAMAAGMWAITSAGLVRAQRSAMPPPAAKRPFVQVTFDRTITDTVLPKNGFIDGRPKGFGIFERWILRLGYFVRRESGPPALEGDLVVFTYPNQRVEPGYVDALHKYVEGGGRALILDSVENTNSTAAALLAPFQLSQKSTTNTTGKVTGPDGFPSIPVEGAREVVGGKAFASLGSTPVAAITRHGKGSVTLVGFGSAFNDSRMGVTGDVEPNAELRKVFDFQFALIRAVVGDKLPPEPRIPSGGAGPVDANGR